MQYHNHIFNRITSVLPICILFFFTTGFSFAMLFAEDDWTVKRVRGETEKEVKQEGERYTFGSLVTGAKSPVGYPRPTPPEVLELKKYPRARRATVTLNSSGQAATSGGFLVLFNHIKKNEIPMTAPVEIKYVNLNLEEVSGAEKVEMSFLYESTETGEEGKNGDVTIQDSSPVTVISTGLTGYESTKVLQKGIPKLLNWVKSSDWEVAGSPRTLSYNNPMEDNPWWEVHIPVRPSDRESKDGKKGNG